MQSFRAYRIFNENGKVHSRLVETTLNELDAGEVVHRGGYLVIAEVGPSKTDAEIGRGRLQCEVHLVAGVKTDSDAGYLSTERTLCVH